MPALPALRQLVFLAGELEPTLTAARAELGLRPGIKDEAGMAALGFVHEVLTIDQTFLEFTAPVAPETMPGRLVARRGDMGYMVVVQVADVTATKARAAGLGIAPVFETPYEDHTITQWHPRDFGTLAEFDQIRPPETWHMAPRIFANRCTDVVGDVTAIELAVADPAAVAATWATVLEVDLDTEGLRLDLSGRSIRFVPAVAGEGLTAVELPAADRGRAGRTVRLSGVEFRLI